MAPLLLIGGLIVASLPAVLHALGRHMRAAEWARLCLIAVVGGTALVEIGALLWAAPTVLRATGNATLASACERLLGPLLPFGAAGGAVATAVAVAVPALAWRGRRRADAQAHRLVIEPGLGRHEPARGHELVVLPTPAPIAYSVVGRVGQVVISEGLCRVLSGDQLAVVIAHERAHLRYRHPALLRLASAASAALRWWPLSKRSHRVLRAGFERWADEVATGGHDDRRRALRDALLTVVMDDQPPAVAALSLAEATAERVEAMDAAPRAGWLLRVGLYVPGVAVWVVAVAAVFSWVNQAQNVWAMTGSCPA